MNLIQKDLYKKRSGLVLACRLPSMENHHSRIFEEEIQCEGNEPKAFVVWTSPDVADVVRNSGGGGRCCIFAHIKFCLRLALALHTLDEQRAAKFCAGSSITNATELETTYCKKSFVQLLTPSDSRLNNLDLP